MRATSGGDARRNTEARVNVEVQRLTSTSGWPLETLGKQKQRS